MKSLKQLEKKYQFESDIKKLGFRKKWLPDKSGYWFERDYKFPIFDKIRICIDSNDMTIIFTVKGCFTYYTAHDDCYADVDMCIKGISDIKKLIKKYKLS